MTADIEEQEDELLALDSIFGSEEFVRNESKTAGEIRVPFELPGGFTVTLEQGETLTHYEISFLPPLLLTFELPEDYPSSSPPSFTLACSWLTHTQLSALGAQLTDLYQATGGAVVLFTWVQFLKEDALSFLDIHTQLQLPSEEYAAPSNTPESGPTDNHNVSDPREADLSAPSLEVENPVVILADDPTSHHGSVSQNGSNPGPNADYQKTSDDPNQTSQAEQTLQTSESDPSSEPAAQPSQSGQEDFQNEGSVSASLLPPSSSSGPPDQNEQGAASPSPPNPDQTLPGPSLTPSKALLSQLLIYDAAQHQKQFATTVFDCGVCYEGWLGSDCVQLPECGHIFCRACLGELCKLQITEGNVRSVTCPEAHCEATPTPDQVRSLVGEELFSRYDRLLLQNTLDCMPDVVYCPRRTCGSAVIKEKSSDAAMCFVCSFAFCVVCKKTYHGSGDCQRKRKVKTETGRDGDTEEASVDLPHTQEGIKALWDDYASGSRERQRLLESRYGRKVLKNTVEDCLSEGWIAFNSKSCPYCFCNIEKNLGCNLMTCSQCRGPFCWACLTRLIGRRTAKHFHDSPCSLYQYN